MDFEQRNESPNKNTLNEISDIYGLNQLINEQTRVRGNQYYNRSPCRCAPFYMEMK